MNNNRIEQQALIDALSPTVDLAELKAALIQSGYSFKKDVVSTVLASGGVAAANFATADQIIVIAGVNADVNVGVTNLEDGQIAKLQVNKSASYILTFAGVDNYEFIGYGLTQLNFLIFRFGSQVSALLLNDEIRTFNLTGVPDTGVTIVTQKNTIKGRMITLSLTIDFYGGFAPDNEIFIGNIPFASEKLAGGVSYISCAPAFTAQTEGCFAAIDHIQSKLYTGFGKDDVRYYVGGAFYF